MKVFCVWCLYYFGCFYCLCFFVVWLWLVGLYIGFVFVVGCGYDWWYCGFDLFWGVVYCGKLFWCESVGVVWWFDDWLLFLSVDYWYFGVVVFGEWIWRFVVFGRKVVCVSSDYDWGVW